MTVINHVRSRERQHHHVGGSLVATVGPGSYCDGGLNVLHWGGETHLEIGNYCSIGEGVRFIVDADHPLDRATTFPLPGNGHASKGPIRLGHDVWVCAGATILSDVTVATGAVVAAGAVVTRNVPVYTIAGGVPARLIRRRFSSDQINALLNSGWWNWPEDKIMDAAPFLTAPMPAFLDWLAQQ